MLVTSKPGKAAAASKRKEDNATATTVASQIMDAKVRIKRSNSTLGESLLPNLRSSRDSKQNNTMSQLIVPSSGNSSALRSQNVSRKAHKRKNLTMKGYNDYVPKFDVRQIVQNFRDAEQDMKSIRRMSRVSVILQRSFIDKLNQNELMQKIEKQKRASISLSNLRQS